MSKKQKKYDGISTSTSALQDTRTSSAKPRREESSLLQYNTRAHYYLFPLPSVQ